MAKQGERRDGRGGSAPLGAPKAAIGALLLLALGACTHTTGTTSTAALAPTIAASATTTHGAPTPHLAAAPVEAAGYYLEFRARPSPVIGHTYMIYGPLDDAGRPLETNYVGMFPEGGILGLAGGIAPLPIPADLEGNWGDKNLPVMSSYKLRLSADQYDRLQDFVARERQKKKYWNIWVYNCNSFAGELAEAVGLRAPALFVVPSQIYVVALRSMNAEGRSTAEVEREMKKHAITPAETGAASGKPVAKAAKKAAAPAAS